MDQVDHDAGEREVTVAQRTDEMLGLTDRLGPRTRHHDERRRLRPQQHRHLAGALRRNPGSMLASDRKNSTVSSTICGPASRRTAHRNIDAAALVTLANARWPDGERAVDGMAEEADEPIGRLEQVDRVARRWRVDDHEIPLAARVQLVQPFDRHVLLRARQRARDRAVDRVGENGLGLLGVRRLLVDEPVERRGGVEHQRPQLTSRPSVPSEHRCTRCGASTRRPARARARRRGAAPDRR